MRTIFPLVAILCIATMGAFMAGSGFNAVVGVDDRGTGQVQEDVAQVANQSSANGSVQGSTQGTDDSSIVGMVLSGASEIGRFFALVALLPGTLENLGFPWWFASPIGNLVRIVISIGILQFVTGRVLR